MLDKELEMHDCIDDVLKYIHSKINNSLKRNTALFFIFKNPLINGESYLFTEHDTVKASIKDSFLLKGLSTKPKKPILKHAEILKIANNALTSRNICRLLDELLYEVKASPSFENVTNTHNLLTHLLDLFNSSQFIFLKDLSSEYLGKIVRILLLCLPQVDTKYSLFKYGTKQDRPITSEEKLQIFLNQIKDFNNLNYNMPFSDRLFLLITLVEGCLWLDKGTFYINNCLNFFQDIVGEKHEKAEPLSENQEYHIQNALNYNSLYLENLSFYIFAKYDFCKTELDNLLVKEIDNLIFFVKFLIADINYSNSKTKRDLFSSCSAGTVINGILNVINPLNVFSGNVKGNDFFPFEKFSIDNNRDSLEKYTSTWANYDHKSFTDPIPIGSISRNSLSINFSEKHILILPGYFDCYKSAILLEFKDEQKDLVRKLQEFPLIFKELIDKYFLINNFTDYNTHNKDWFYKAFCRLYIKCDLSRFLEEEYSASRNWEIKYFKSLINRMYEKVKRDIIIYDFGIGYGRLVRKILKKSNEGDEDANYILKKAKFIGIDLSDTIVKEIESLNKELKENHFDEIKIVINDFRNINYLLRLQDEHPGTYPKPDIILFNYTTFGYLGHRLNFYILYESLGLLNHGGSVIIDQYNPNPEKAPDHVKRINSPELFPIADDSGNIYKVLKTSNYGDERGKTIYHGNYVYFLKSNGKEQLIKFDEYRIWLYPKKWFEAVVKAYNSISNANTYKVDLIESFEGLPESQIIIEINNIWVPLPSPEVLMKKKKYLIENLLNLISDNNDCLLVQENQKKLDPQTINDLVRIKADSTCEFETTAKNIILNIIQKLKQNA